MDNILTDMKKTLLELDRVEARFLAGKISKIMEKNRFHLFYDRNDELTSLGEVLVGVFEMLFTYGMLKWQPGGGDCEEAG